VNLKSVKVDLPQAANSSADNSKDLTDVSVDKSGGIYLDAKLIGANELVRALVAAKQANPNLRVMIDGDRDARYGQIIHVEDLVRSAGIDRVALDIRPQQD
jgi:biopolymer transport protein ExbD